MVLKVEDLQPNNSIQEGDFVKFSPTNQVQYIKVYISTKRKSPKNTKLVNAYTSIFTQSFPYIADNPFSNLNLFSHLTAVN